MNKLTLMPSPHSQLAKLSGYQERKGVWFGWAGRTSRGNLDSSTASTEGQLPRMHGWSPAALVAIVPCVTGYITVCRGALYYTDTKTGECSK